MSLLKRIRSPSKSKSTAISSIEKLLHQATLTEQRLLGQNAGSWSESWTQLADCAAKGSSRALALVGWARFWGYFPSEARNLVLGRRQVEAAAVKGDPLASALVLILGWSGLAVDEHRASLLLIPLSEEDPFAANTLGHLHLVGKGIQRDANRAVVLTRRAANLGHAVAAFNMGKYCWSGIGIPQNKQRAVSWWKRAAVWGHAVAQERLGTCLISGLGVEQDEVQAVAWWQLSAAQNDAKAAYSLGLTFAQGRGGVEPNPRTAFNWVKKAADLGSEEAKIALQTMVDGSDAPSNQPVRSPTVSRGGESADDAATVINAASEAIAGLLDCEATAEPEPEPETVVEAETSGAFDTLVALGHSQSEEPIPPTFVFQPPSGELAVMAPQSPWAMPGPGFADAMAAAQTVAPPPPTDMPSPSQFLEERVVTRTRRASTLRMHETPAYDLPAAPRRRAKPEAEVVVAPLVWRGILGHARPVFLANGSSYIRWDPRWVAIDGTAMRFYRRVEDLHPVATIGVDAIMGIVPRPPSRHRGVRVDIDRTTDFSVSTVGTSHLLRASTPQDRDDWIKAVNTCCHPRQRRGRKTLSIAVHEEAPPPIGTPLEEPSMDADTLAVCGWKPISDSEEDEAETLVSEGVRVTVTSGKSEAVPVDIKNRQLERLMRHEIAILEKMLGMEEVLFRATLHNIQQKHSQRRMPLEAMLARKRRLK